MPFQAFDADGQLPLAADLLLRRRRLRRRRGTRPAPTASWLDDTPVRYPFTTGAELLAHCAGRGCPISDVMLANELSWRTEAEVRAGLLHLWGVMQECVETRLPPRRECCPAG